LDNFTDGGRSYGSDRLIGLNLHLEIACFNGKFCFSAHDNKENIQRNRVEKKGEN
jgi:hypothetical protein